MMSTQTSPGSTTDSGNKLSATRRKAIIAGGAAAITSISGCSGLLGTSGSTGDGFDGPSAPWTTEELAQAAQETGQTSINLYSPAGETKTWNKWESVIQDEYPWFEIGTLVTGRGEETTQKVVQEHQADQVTADICGEVPSLIDDQELRREIFKRDYAGEYAHAEDYPTAYQETFISTHNRGPSLSLPYNKTQIEELDLDLPDSYNDFLDDPQYEGMDMLIVQDPNMKRFGWIVSYHAAQKEMTPTEWFQEMNETLNFRIGSGHTNLERHLGTGESAPMMFYSYPWTVNNTESSGLPVTNHYVDNIPYFISSGILAEVNQAPNPWGARFFLSVAMEPFVQKSLATEIPTFTPERQDIDYSNLDVDPAIERRISVFGNMDNIGFDKEQELVETGKQTFGDVFGTPQVEIN